MDKVIIESSFVNSLFKCPLCNELIHSPTVINECLHRFCKLCIINYFEKNNNKTCPICQIILINPMQTLKSDFTFQRLLYKIFPTIFQYDIASKSSQLINNDKSKLSHIQSETKINIYLEYWDISLNLFPNKLPIKLSKCYLECLANTPLLSIEKFLRFKYSLLSTLKIDLFYQSFSLNTENERLIDVCYCFDITDKNPSLDIRFTISPYGYKSIRKCIHQSKQVIPLKIEVLPSTINSSLSSTSSIDSTLKVKLCRSQSSTNNWYIPQSTSSNKLPDLINSCKKKSIKTKLTNLKKPRRRIRFIPTMVQIPPSIFDRLSKFNTFQSNEIVNSNIEDNSTNSNDIKSTISTQKTICKVPPYIPENISINESSSSLLEKSSSTYSLFDNNPLDLSLK